jgi:hypothetical protein
VDLIQQLDEIGKRINKAFPMINDGGCCIYAVMIAKELKKLGYRPRIIVAGRDDEVNVQEARKKIKDIANHHEWWENGIYFNHVGIEFTYKRKKYHYDSCGVKPASKMLDEYYIYPGRLGIKDAEVLANQSTAWNVAFNRNDIPKIQRRISDFFDPDCWVLKRWLRKFMP